MAEKTMCISQQQTKPIKILKWKVSEGNTASIGRVILLYDFEGALKEEQRKLKVTQAGTVHKILAQEGAIVNPGETLCELKECTHPTVMNDMCGECGTDLRKNDVTVAASVPMVHAIPDLKVSEELAQKLGKADVDRLIKDRKLVLLVDLDQTLIHTTNDNIQANIKDVYRFQLYGPNSPWYFTRLRPGTHQFLNNIHPLFELHICTFGARNYAHMIAAFLDKDQKFFSNRILSRDECFDPTSKKANLKALFPCGDNMVCIIDDREDVWSNASNLIHVKPYHFFQHTGDINAPPGLDKQENDNKAGVDLTKIKEMKKVEQNNESDKPSNNDKSTEDVENKQSVPVHGKTGYSEEKKSVTTADLNGENKDESKCENLNHEEDTSKTECRPSVNINNEKEINSQNEEMKSQDDNMKSQNENMKGQDEEMKRQNENMKGQDEEMKRQNEKMMTENKKMMSQNENIEKNPDENMKSQDEERTRQNEEMKSQDEEMKSQDEEMKSQDEEMKSQDEEMKSQDEEMKSQDEEMKSQDEEMKSQYEEMKSQNEEMKSQDEEMNSQNQEVKSQNENMKSQDEEMSSQNQDMKSQNENTNNQGEEMKIQNNVKPQENNLIEIEDPDDYLLHLEDILKRIHTAFYEDYDKMESGEVPDLKKVIPRVRGRVLRRCKLVFSGLVPTHIKLEQSKAYQIAKSLGAEVTQELEEFTTHLVAVRPGTAKVNAGRRKKNLKIVTPDWLWSCAERWEHVSEKIFALNSKGSKNRHPPPHCSSPEHIISYPEHNTPAIRKRTPSGRFMDTINPLMSFSSADIADMDKEVEDILDNDSDSSEDETSKKVAVANVARNDESTNNSSSSSEDSLTGEYPKGYKRKREDNDLANDLNNSTEDDEMPSIKFRRGELVDELDLEQDSQESDGSVEAPDEVDDGEWNMMGAALEREFLSNN